MWPTLICFVTLKSHGIDARDRVLEVVLDPECTAAGDDAAGPAADLQLLDDAVRRRIDAHEQSRAVVVLIEELADDGAAARLRAAVGSFATTLGELLPSASASTAVTSNCMSSSSGDILRFRTNMIRNRSNVKLQPGLFLQPFVVSQLVGTVLEDVVAGSGISARSSRSRARSTSLGSVTPTELARTLGLSPTTLSATIDRLVRKGEVRRAENPDDGRSYVLEPTAQGKATNARIARRFGKAIGTVRGHLGSDPEDVLAALRLLEDALRATIAEGA